MNNLLFAVQKPASSKSEMRRGVFYVRICEWWFLHSTENASFFALKNSFYRFRRMKNKVIKLIF